MRVAIERPPDTSSTICLWGHPITQFLIKYQKSTYDNESIVCHKCFCITYVLPPDGNGEVFAEAKVKLLCSEVWTYVQVKLSLPTLPKAKLHYPKDYFTYEVNFTCSLGQT